MGEDLKNKNERLITQLEKIDFSNIIPLKQLYNNAN